MAIVYLAARIITVEQVTKRSRDRVVYELMSRGRDGLAYLVQCTRCMSLWLSLAAFGISMLFVSWSQPAFALIVLIAATNYLTGTS